MARRGAVDEARHVAPVAATLGHSGREYLHLRGQVAFGQVGVALRHSRAGVAQDILQGRQVVGAHDENRGEGMSEVVKAEAVNLRGHREVLRARLSYHFQASLLPRGEPLSSQPRWAVGVAGR